MSLKVIPFNEALIKGFKYDGIEREFTGEDILPALRFYNLSGAVYMVLAEGKVITIGGVYPMWGGNGGCFLFVNKEATLYKKQLFKVLREYMSALIRRYGLTNLMTDCIDNIKAHTLLEHLGFKKTIDTKMSHYVKVEGAK